MTGIATDLLERRFKESRDEIFLTLPSGASLTYGEVWAHAARIADHWAEQGIPLGAAVALMLPNGAEFLCCYLACFIGGYIAVPVNTDLPAEDVDHLLDIAQPSLILNEPPELPDGIDTGMISHLRSDSSQINAIFFTSGTTGRPKGVCHSLNSLIGNVMSFNRMMRLGSETRLYHVMPMAYMAGFLNTFLSPLMAGGRVIIGPRFSAQSAMDFWSQPARQGAQTLWLSPSMAAALIRMTRNPEAAWNIAANFAQIFCGTAPLHRAIRESFLETFSVPLQESYGTSELLLISAQSRSGAMIDADVGTVLPELELDQRPYMAEENQLELVVRSPFAYHGYLTDEGTVPAEETEDGFVRTGDMGEVCEGHLVITGRLKDIIIRGGVNVAPIALENALSKINGISDVAVVGLPHPFWGESICICVEVCEVADRADLENAVRKYCREHFAKSHQPDRIEFFDVFPRAVTGKIQKGELRKRAGV